MTHRMHDWLILLGTRKFGTKYVLDGIDPEFCLYFDADECLDNPDAVGTVDVLLGFPSHPEYERVRILADANEPKVMRLLFALGVSRFSDKTKRVLYSMSNPLRDPSHDPTE